VKQSTHLAENIVSGGIFKTFIGVKLHKMYRKNTSLFVIVLAMCAELVL
jgi:hypothetical protein